MECVVSSLIIVGGVRCFFFNYCVVECVVSSLIIVGGVRCSSPIIVGGVRCFFFNYCGWNALFLL